MQNFAPVFVNIDHGPRSPSHDSVDHNGLFNHYKHECHSHDTMENMQEGSNDRGCMLLGVGCCWITAVDAYGGVPSPTYFSCSYHLRWAIGIALGLLWHEKNEPVVTYTRSCGETVSVCLTILRGVSTRLPSHRIES